MNILDNNYDVSDTLHIKLFVFVLFQEMACEALDIFDILLEMELPVLSPYVKEIVEFSLAVSVCVKLYEFIIIVCLVQ